MLIVTKCEVHRRREDLKTPKLEKVLRVHREIKAIHIRFSQTSRNSFPVKRSYTCSTPKLPIRKDLDYPIPYNKEYDQI